MSVVVVKKFDDKIEIGADSQVTVYGREKQIHHGLEDGTALSKLHKLSDELIFGSVGSGRECIFMKNFCQQNIPAESSEDVMTNFYNGYVEYAGDRVNQPYYTENDFIFVYKDKIWLFSDFCAREIHSFEAIGSGRQYALGVLHASSEKTGIKKALEAAATYDLYCHEPITIYKVNI